MKAEGGSRRARPRPSTTGPLDHSTTSFVYGPVPSRRLGLSLGINIIPRKTCTLDCVYCQCGRTTAKTLKRESFYPVKDILAEIRAAIRQSPFALRHSPSAIRNSSLVPRPASLDYLTFSGEGEPTLDKDIGRIIRALKREHRIPVAVITNSTLMSDPQVRRDLYAADLVVPSLDAADQRTFARVDRCHRDLKVADIIEGLQEFRRYYRGKMWLEIMLVKGINDSVEHVVALRRLTWQIRPDRVQLNTVVRPPAEKFARPVSRDDLEQMQMLFGPNTDIANQDKSKTPNPKPQGRAGLQPKTQNPKPKVRCPSSLVPRPSSSRILATVRGRPVTRQDLARSLGIPSAPLTAALRRLVRQGRIRRVRYSGKTFFEPT